MKYLSIQYFTLLSMGILFSLHVQAQDKDFFTEADHFFRTYVSYGMVDYEAIAANPQALEALISQVETRKPQQDNGDQLKAFFINAYNLHVIHAVVQVWPIRSPQEVPGFFDRQKHTTRGQSLTLNQLEKELIFPMFPDARLHFVLVCGAIGCPPLTHFAYRPEQLEKQLDIQTKKALNHPDFVKVDDDRRRVELSQIFEWYTRDFAPRQSELLTYLNKYRYRTLPQDYQVGFYTYDWSLNGRGDALVTADASGSGDDGVIPTQKRSNIQYFTPSILLPKGKVEIKIFNNLYTQTAFRNGESQRVSLDERQTYFTGIIQFNYGISPTSRINIGFETDIFAVRQDQNEGSSPLRVFGNNQDGLNFNKAALGYFGPRIRVAPFRSIPNLSVTSTLLLPLRTDLELFDENDNRRFLAHNRVSWWTQFFYDKSFGKFQLFTEADFLYRFSTDQVSFDQDAFFRTPLTVFFSYFPTSRTTVNVNFQYSPAFAQRINDQGNKRWTYDRYFMQGGMGAKYQLTPEINLELLYTNFFASRNEGAGQTFNFGIVFIR